MAEILSFIGSIPELIKLAREISKWVNKISGNDPAGLFLKAHEAFKQANDAKTDSEKADAAAALAKLFARH